MDAGTEEKNRKRGRSKETTENVEGRQVGEGLPKYLFALIMSWQAVTETKEEVPVMRLLLVIYYLRHTRQHSCPIPI